jgi:hypothetical protein
MQNGCSIKTIQRKLDAFKLADSRINIRPIVLLLDTSYWGRNFGVMLFKDSYTKENLLWYFVKYETNVLYLKGINKLREQGYTIKAVVCDGRKGLFKLIDNTPIQMCQFHQSAIIRRYLTKKPKLQAAIELMVVSDLMKSTDKESFEGAVKMWFTKWESFLNERTPSAETGKSHYTHKRLRSAYRSLKTNLPYLFTWYDNMELNIPNTTNAIDGHFSDLKTKLRNHNGLIRTRKRKFIDGFFKAYGSQ